ncbi:MAG: prolyl oligopeptidase family serine peptidase [Chloroflexota bacterium]|nr:prolyl oligopeptidase family serine peptidase [Chloroflexota bacterium]
MLEIERRELAGIPCITLRDTRVEQAPVIIHYHGWTGGKGAVETPDQSQARLASAGFLVVAPDCFEHGERATEAWFRAQFNGWAFICQAMDKTRQEAANLFDAVMALPFSSARDPQVTGGSMGGLIAQMAFAENKAFVSLVSVVGRSSFYQADEWCRRAQAGSWCDDWCAEYATQSHPERFTDRSVLFIDGAQDTDCPPAVNAETVRLINERGGSAEHFVDPDFGHGFSQPMRDKFVDWLVARGKPPAKAQAVGAIL